MIDPALGAAAPASGAMLNEIQRPLGDQSGVFQAERRWHDLAQVGAVAVDDVERDVGKQRREPQHPPVDGDVADLDPTLDRELLEVAVGQAEA
jgi:hypothetical protein